MSRVIREAVQADILSNPPDWITTKWLLEAMPYVFKAGTPDTFWNWKNQIAKKLGVDPMNIIITGSSAVGVSLSPYKNLRSHTQKSDVDVAVISTYHFDLAWRSLRNLGTRRYNVTPEQAVSIKEHVTKFIYWGTIATDRILPILPFSEEWMKAAEDMSKVSPTKDREIKFRIYRDFSSLRAYMNMGIKEIREKLITGNESSETKIV